MENDIQIAIPKGFQYLDYNIMCLETFKYSIYQKYSEELEIGGTSSEDINALLGNVD